MAGIALMYHNISQPRQKIDFPAWSPFYDVSGGQFLKHLKVIRASRMPVELTFDDGYKSLVIWARTELYVPGKIVCACFVTTGAIGRAGMLTAREIRELAVQGVRIGAHSHTHRFLSGLNRRELELEIRMPKHLLEDITGCEVTAMSLPGGRFDRQALEYAADCGYGLIYSSEPGYRPRTPHRPGELTIVPRWPIRASTSTDEILRILYHDPVFNFRRRSWYFTGRIARRVFGNGTYHSFWRALNDVE